MQYRKHVDVKDALNPKNHRSVTQGTALPEYEYLAYAKLQLLYRRSRFLVKEKDGKIADDKAFLTFDVHPNKSLKHINTVIKYFCSKYEFIIPAIAIICEGVKAADLYFAK